MTVEKIAAKKSQGEKIAMLTCYDFPTAVIEDGAGIDILLVGDSVGTNVLGYSDIREVTMDDMVHHVSAVARGTSRAFVLADMPYGSCATAAEAISNARRLIEAGAHGVKIEGEKASAALIGAITRAGIAVCGHIGYTPQTRGPKAEIQGKGVVRARELIEAARALESSGVFMIVLELVPEELCREITILVAVPTIGIGAGRFCDGQVQVVNDLLGLSPKIYRHARAYIDARKEFTHAIRSYAEDVRAGFFPEEKNAFSISEEVIRAAMADGTPATEEHR